MVQKKGKTLYERVATSMHDLDKSKNKDGKVNAGQDIRQAHVKKG